MGIAGDIALILIACVLCALIAQRLGFPLLLGYITAGVIVGPNTSGPTVGAVDEIELLADIGVALLLFTIGLEFPVEKLMPVRHIALIGAPLQMLLVGAFGFGLGKLVGWDWQQAVWFGALISISSTMVVLKVLMGRGLMETLSSKVMLAILVVQDLAVIPMMILLPAMGDLETGMDALGVALLRAGLFVGFMLLVGVRFLPWILYRVVKWKSRELFIVVVLTLGLGVGYATYLVGLSFAFGAFLAGLVLSRSEYSHDALTDMIPLREVFSLLFFASVGMLISPRYLLDHVGLVLGLVLAVLIGKGILLGLVTRAFGYRKIVPLAVALSMSQVGEFAFVLAREGRESGGLNEDVYFVVISVAVVTMGLTPFSSSPAYRLYRWWQGNVPEDLPEVQDYPTAVGRPVLLGYGSLGGFVGRLLKELGHSPLVLDSDFERVRLAREAGLEAFCAEGTSPEAINRLELAQASIVLLAISDRYTSQVVAEQLQQMGGPSVVAVGMSPEHLEDLCSVGVEDVVLAPLETGLEMVHQTLLNLNYDELEAHSLVDVVRKNHYRIGSELKESRKLGGLRMEWVDLTADRRGRLDELQVRSQTGASIVAVIRDGELIADTGASFELEVGDKVAAVGSPEQRGAFKDWANEALEAQPKEPLGPGDICA